MRIEDYVALRVKELCDEHGISRYRLSQLTGISQTALGNIVKRSNLPSIPNLEKICDAFGITLAQFFAKGERPDLTELQIELLDTWSQLDGKERDILITFVRSLKGK